MPHNVTFALALGAGNSGLTLQAQVKDTTGTNVGAAVTSGFVDLTLGAYEWTGAIPDGQAGCVTFATSPGGIVKAAAALNPAETENADVRTSAVAAAVWAVGSRTLTAFAFTVDILQSAADKVWASAARTLTAFSTTLGQAVWDVLTSAVAVAGSVGVLVKTDLDTNVGSRLATAGYTAPDNATVDSMALEVTEMHGLLGQNSGLRNTVYSGANLVSYDLNIYSSAGNAATNDGVTGLLHKYSVVNSYDGSGNLLGSVMTRVS